MEREFHEALFALARRITGDPNVGTIRGWIDIVNNPRQFQCNICGNRLASGDKLTVEKHGLQHLKEYNLLPFI